MPPLPPAARCVTIAPMAKRRPQSETPPDLFSTAPHVEAGTADAPAPPAPPVAPQIILPKDLPAAIARLPEDELKTLARAVNEELERRNLRTPSELVSGQATNPAGTRVATSKKPSRRTSRQANAQPLTQSRVNAIRAAFKAGVKSSTIARQFGVSRSAIQEALTEKTADR
jgi:crotonobetainyl-CoA:carnitine CoA-transferase CaiB-like acyl-CoA transferase